MISTLLMTMALLLPGSGTKSGLVVVRTGIDSIQLSTGRMHCGDGTTAKTLVAGQPVSKTSLSIASDRWYYVYVELPTSGDGIGASQVSISTTVPTPEYSTKRWGWYLGSSGSKRCVGFFLTDGDAEIVPFIADGKHWRFVGQRDVAYSQNISDTWTTIDLGSPHGVDFVHIVAFARVVSKTGVTNAVTWRRVGSSDSGLSLVGVGDGSGDAAERAALSHTVTVDEFGRGEAHTNGAAGWTCFFRLTVSGYAMPQWIGDSP